MTCWENTDSRFWEARQPDRAGVVAELLAQLPPDVKIVIGWHGAEESPVHIIVYDSEQKIVAL